MYLCVFNRVGIRKNYILVTFHLNCFTWSWTFGKKDNIKLKDYYKQIDHKIKLTIIGQIPSRLAGTEHKQWVEIVAWCNKGIVGN